MSTNEAASGPDPPGLTPAEGTGGSERPGASSAAPERGAKARISKRRLILVDVMIVIATVLAVVGMLSVWANRLLFNPDNWENTSTQLLQNSDIRSATANYVVDQLYANVDVASLIKSRSG
jgi:hypothetical protein